ncbi:hypothetical protein [Nakamurella sp.]|uniref:putative acetyltransferase n=1 Tax=Nakamurella sp. TaxID=1869182 RepID=UPI003B3AA355
MTGPPDPTTTTGPTPAAGAAPLAGAPAGTEPAPADLLRSVPPGTRVVARHRVPGGFTDALGYLRSCDGIQCEIQTRRGPVTVVLANVVAAKPVPEPPPRRPR